LEQVFFLFIHTVHFTCRFPHIKKMYYQVFNEDDVVWDFDGASSYREDSSISMDPAKLQILTDAAMETMYGLE
jgi:hypothetical protein